MFGLALHGPVVIALEVAGGLVSGAIFGASPTRRVVAGAIAVLGLALPFLASPNEHVARAFAALGGILGLMRFIEALRTRSEPPIPRALAFALPIDLLLARRAPPRFAGDVLARACVHAAVLAAGLWLLSVRASAGEWAPLVAWVGGVVALYGAVDTAASTLRAFLMALGVETSPMQRDPILSTSVSEFWGERWNRAVGTWLRRHCFVPAMRRGGPALGIAAAFAFSAFAHFWMILAGLGLEPAIRTAAFFGVQAIVVVVETRLSLRAWPRPLARLWTFALVLGPSPLFVGPVLETFGVH